MSALGEDITLTTGVKSRVTSSFELGNMLLMSGNGKPTTSMVWPSGADFATSSVAITVQLARLVLGDRAGAKPLENSAARRRPSMSCAAPAGRR